MNGTPVGKDVREARRQHRQVWLVTLVIGAAFIVVANVFGWWPWLIALALSALMVAFGVSIRETEVGSDSKGDSFYYLGLLFTFMALIAALIAFDWGSDATRTIGIIRNFGIALVTTIWGLAGRVWYAMSGDAPGDLEEALRGDLEDAVSEMKGSLDRARDHLDILVNAFKTSGKAMAATAEGISATARQAEQTAKALDEQTKRVAETTESLAGRMIACHEAIAGGATAAQQVRESVAGIGKRSALLEKQVASAGQDVRDVNSALGKARRATGSISRGIRESAEGVAAVAAEAASLRGAVSGLQWRAQETDSVFKQMGAHAQQAGQQVRSTLMGAERHADQGSRSVQRLAAQASAVKETLALIRESAGEAQNGIGNVADNARSLEEQVAAIDGRRLSDSVGSARRRSDQLDSALSELQGQSGRLSQSLTQASDEAELLSEETRDLRRKIRSRREAPRLLGRICDVFARRRSRVPETKPR